MKNSLRQELSEGDLSNIVQMAWDDRTSFESIREQFGLTPGQVISLMRSHLKPSSFKLWRARTTGRKTKHPKLMSAPQQPPAEDTGLPTSPRLS